MRLSHEICLMKQYVADLTMSTDLKQVVQKLGMFYFRNINLIRRSYETNRIVCTGL